MRKTVYRLKKFRLNEVSLVDRPACAIATLERIELIKRRDSLDTPPPSNTNPAQENHSMTSEELGELPDSKADVAPAIGFVGETVTADYPPGASIAGESALAGGEGLAGKALLIETDYPITLAPGELRKYVPIDALPIVEDDSPLNDATSLPAAIAENAGEQDLGELCDLFMLVVRNILRAAGIEDKSAAILTAADDFKAAVTKLLAEPQLTKRLGPSRWRERAMRVEHAMRTSLHKRALADALHQINFTWPAGAAAIRVLGKDDRPMGWLGKADFQKRGAALSAANRSDMHKARDILVKMCTGAGCDQDRALSAYMDNPIDASPTALPGKTTALASAATGPEPAAELGKLLDDLRRAAGTLGSTADEVRKVAEASAGSIRKAEGSAKVLTALADRVARLEAQPDTSRPQPLRAVEKGILIESAATAADDIRLRINQLQSEAAELRKRGGDVTAQKRLSEIGVEIIRLSNGAYYPAA